LLYKGKDYELKKRLNAILGIPVSSLSGCIKSFSSAIFVCAFFYNLTFTGAEMDSLSHYFEIAAICVPQYDRLLR